MINRQIVFSDKWTVGLNKNQTGFQIKQDQLLVKTLYSLVSPGTELACLNGLESWAPFPYIPGYTSVGKVIECGCDISMFKKGDIVFWYGRHEDYGIISPKEDFCIAVPADIDLKMVPFVRMASIAITSLRQSDIELGDWVGVSGQGIVGNLAAQFAALQGSNVIVIDVSDERLSMSSKCGIAYTINSCNENTVQKIKELTSGEMLDSFIEATGNPSVALQASDYLRKKGELILLGTPRGEFITDITSLLRKVHIDNTALRLKSALEWVYPIKPDPFVKHCFERNTRIIFDLIKSHKLNINPMLTHILRSEAAEEAYFGLRDRKNEYLGVLFDWNI